MGAIREKRATKKAACMTATAHVSLQDQRNSTVNRPMLILAWVVSDNRRSADLFAFFDVQSNPSKAWTVLL
jgi:hypothetical protein